MSHSSLSLLLAASLLSFGCETTGTIRKLPEAAASTEGALGAGDVLEVRVLQEAEISGDYRVDASGRIGFPYVGTVDVASRTPEALASHLAGLLKEGGFFQAPVVTVLVKEFNSRVVYVLGSVRTPGSYTYTDGMGVIDAISMAGGVLETGQANGTTVTRKVDGVEYSVSLPVSRIVAGRLPDQRLAVGDIIFVPDSPI